ncbi:transposase [Flavivirga aquimarina]|uniref:Transposase n=1 Tax=Flavivirga aquimarina TaxID=2027862 RepID=A0ABT8WEF2_9FLAO|nr:transposase [Flavivirga aquimarina]MDO5971381.1 transposase [Flavivirga aquimarina]
MGQLSVDTGHHVITDIKTYHADGKDSQYLPDICNRLERRLHKQGLLWHTCIADTGYSSGENYAFLEAKGLRSYIPPHGTYKGGSDGFKYHKADNCYTCPQGKVIPFKKVFFEKKNHTKKKEYRALKPVCVDCPIRSACLGKSAQEKKFTVTFYLEGYERNNARVNSSRGSYMKGKGQSAVEPVLGTLTQFLGLRKINYHRH